MIFEKTPSQDRVSSMLDDMASDNEIKTVVYEADYHFDAGIEIDRQQCAALELIPLRILAEKSPILLMPVPFQSPTTGKSEADRYI